MATISLRSSLQHAVTAAQANPLSSALAGIVSIILIRRISKDYQDWYNLGPGGAPHNLYGYTLNSFLHIFLGSDDVKSSFCYESMGSSKGYLEDLPIREGIDPVVSKWALPVRQLSARAGERRVQQVNTMLEELAAEHDLVFAAPSSLEGGRSKALFIEAKTEDDAEKREPTKDREVFHCHESEGSAHAKLSPADAKLVLDLGWGRRHPLSGKTAVLPITYIMIYAPRNDAEVEIHKKIAQATIAYALERRCDGTL